MTLDDALQKYETVTRARGYSPRTIVHVRRCVGLFASYLGGIPNPEQVTADDLRRYLAGLRQAKRPDGTGAVSPTTLNTYTRAVKSFWSLLATEGIFASNPLAVVRTPKKGTTLPRVYSPAELNQVLQSVRDNPRDQAIVYLVLDSGIRLGELIGLMLDDVDLEAGQVIVHGKGNRERRAFFSPLTTTSLRAYLEKGRPSSSADRHFFLNQEGRPFKDKRLQDILEEIGKRAGLTSRLGPHRLRHSYATLSLKYGGNLEYIKSTLGHADIETTSQSYIHVSNSDIAAAYQRFSPIANLLSAGATTPPVKPATPEMPKDQGTVPERYEETPHRQKMRELASTTAENIRLPSSWDEDLWRNLPLGFQPGKYYLPLGTVVIGANIQINVTYPDVMAGMAEPHLIQGLHSHLGTSGLSQFTGLVGDQGQLNEIAVKSGKCSREILAILKTMIDEVMGYSTTVFFHDETKPGLTKWFILSAWHDALQKAAGHAWIDDSWYKPHESIPNTDFEQLKCGAYIIGIARSAKTLKTYENWHKRLRAKYAAHPLAINIALTQQELDNLALIIRRRLQEFSEMEHLPGHCELCRY